MYSRCKLAGLLTPAQGELLKTLFDLHRQLGPDRFWKPRDLGAFRSSHHALTLKRLLERGLVDRVALQDEGARPIYAYRITEDGRQVWLLFRAMAEVPPHSVFGGEGAQARAQVMAAVVC